MIACRPAALVTEIEHQRLEGYPKDSSSKRAASPIEENEMCKRNKTD